MQTQQLIKSLKKKEKTYLIIQSTFFVQVFQLLLEIYKKKLKTRVVSLNNMYQTHISKVRLEFFFFRNKIQLHNSL